MTMDHVTVPTLRIFLPLTLVIVSAYVLIYSPLTYDFSRKLGVSSVRGSGVSSMPSLEQKKNQSFVEETKRLEDFIIKRRMPKCLIIGFAKCGTYALKSFLSLHPNIVSAENETQFFSKFYSKGFDWYRHQMPLSTKHQITLEKTPNYAESRAALKRIRAFNASIKLIVIVRDPVVRLQSSYAHFMSKSKDSEMAVPFEDWCGNDEAIMQRMDLSPHFIDMYSFFRREQILVLSEEDLESDPLKVMQQVETFLGLQHAFAKDSFVFNPNKGFYCFNTSDSKYNEITRHVKMDRETGCFKKNKGRAHPSMNKTFLKHLTQLALPCNKKLFNITHKRFPWTAVEEV